MGKLIVPKIVGDLKLIHNKAGGYSVWNGIKKGSNKIMIPCKNESEGNKIINKILDSRTGELISF